jgi:hypothetical protein
VRGQRSQQRHRCGAAASPPPPTAAAAHRRPQRARPLARPRRAGREVAAGLMARGAHVVMACRNMEACARVQRELQQQQPAGSCSCQYLDLEKAGTVRAFAEQLQQELGRQGRPLRVLVNNAGAGAGAAAGAAGRAWAPLGRMRCSGEGARRRAPAPACLSGSSCAGRPAAPGAPVLGLWHRQRGVAQPPPPACATPAGVMGVAAGPDGQDRHLLANHLGPYLLTRQAHAAPARPSALGALARARRRAGGLPARPTPLVHAPRAGCCCPPCAAARASSTSPAGRTTGARSASGTAASPTTRAAGALRRRPRLPTDGPLRRPAPPRRRPPAAARAAPRRGPAGPRGAPRHAPRLAAAAPPVRACCAAGSGSMRAPSCATRSSRWSCSSGWRSAASPPLRSAPGLLAPTSSPACPGPRAGCWRRWRRWSAARPRRWGDGARPGGALQRAAAPGACLLARRCPGGPQRPRLGSARCRCAAGRGDGCVCRGGAGAGGPERAVPARLQGAGAVGGGQGRAAGAAAVGRERGAGGAAAGRGAAAVMAVVEVGCQGSGKWQVPQVASATSGK